MAEVSQNTKYVKLDDGVSFGLVRTNPKLTTNTKLMYNGKKMYMESYASSELLNRMGYKNFTVKPNSIFNKDIATFLTGSGSQAYNVYHNFSNTTISDSYDNQFETIYWCGAEHVGSSFYTEDIGFIAPLYIREKLPNYFLIFRLDTPSNYNLNVDEYGNILDSTFDFKSDIINKAVLIKTFDLREGTVLGDYIHRYIEQDGFEFDKSMYVNFSNAEVTYYGINKVNGVLEKKVESFENNLLKNDNPISKDDKWFTEGFERNNLIFPYIMNIEYLFDDDNFNHKYDFARYIGVYCNNIEFGEFVELNDLKQNGDTQDNAIYYFEDNEKNLHRYTLKMLSESSEPDMEFKIDGKDVDLFDEKLISGFEREHIVGYAEPLNIYEGFINRAQYGFEILKPLEPGDWIGIEYDGHVECYFADNKNRDGGEEYYDMMVGEYSDFRFYVNENSSLNDIAEALAKCVNHNKKSKFEASCTDNVVVFYAKREGKEYNGSEFGGAKILIESSLLYNRKISLPISNTVKHVSESDFPIENISDSDFVMPVPIYDNNGVLINNEKSSFGDYYVDYFCGACIVDIDPKTDTYKNIFKIYSDESVFFNIGRYLKTNNGNGRKICVNMIYINAEGKIEPNYRIVIVEDANDDNKGDIGYDVSVSSMCQVEIMDRFKPNHGVLSWFPIKDFDFDMNYSSYGQYGAFADECNYLSRKIKYDKIYNTELKYIGKGSEDYKPTSTQKKSIVGIKELAKSPFFDDFGNSLETEYDYYYELIHPDLCLLSKTVPYISKWGYYDEQKDSCENPYRLNVNKIFGVSNLSANTYLRNCDENEYTHSMPYYMTMNMPNYYKEYQYIESDEIYRTHVDGNKNNQYVMPIDDDTFNKVDVFFQCVEYWITEFKRTDVDRFSDLFSNKKYGKRFDRKYSRLLGGDKFHNPSTLFRGVKFEVVRQFNGVEKRSSEYNGYKFSFIYIPVMNKSMIFNDKVYFVKNDKFKFIVGIVFVNTMLGKYDHNIFRGELDYFNKGFLYAACQDTIRPENPNDYNYNLTLEYAAGDLHQNPNSYIENIYNEIWKENYQIGKENKFYMWIWDNKVFVTKTRNVAGFSDNWIIGEFNIEYGSDSDDVVEGIENISKPKFKYTLYTDKPNNDDEFNVAYEVYHENFDTTIYRCITLKYYGSINCELGIPNIDFENMPLIETCDLEWTYYDGNDIGGYEVDISELYFKSNSLKNIFINMGVEDSIISIKIHDGNNVIRNFENDKNGVRIIVNYMNGSVKIESGKNEILRSDGSRGETIDDLKIDIVIKDKFDANFDSLGFKDYFSAFNELSAYNISNNINNDYKVEYHSTVEDNKYKIKVIDPDSVEVEDRYEAIPVKITQNNKHVLGSVEIKEKRNIDKIGIKVINRYSGFYNPIFNDILYYDDYVYTKNVGKLKSLIKFNLPYSNTNIDYKYGDKYGDFGVIKNMYYHKTNVLRSNNILSSTKPIYPAINEYALDYRDYNIFSSSWDEGYFISQDNLNTRSVCKGIGSMKDGLCMFGSKYLNLPDYIFIDTFENGKHSSEKISMGIRDNTDIEIMYKEINNRTVKYHLFIEKRLKRYLSEHLIEVFSKYINKTLSFGDKGNIEDDVNEYVEKNLLKLYKVDKVFMYVKGERVNVRDKVIENEYLKYVDKDNMFKIKNGFPVISDGEKHELKNGVFTLGKTDEFDRDIVYNLNVGFKESFGFAVSFRRK